MTRPAIAVCIIAIALQVVSLFIVPIIIVLVNRRKRDEVHTSSN